ncbi:UNVERIFIED_ORG: hypothetical protein C7430_1154 [Pantoea agglomerans]|uniref:Uncharacterized protein n=1 Tax=Enterobacter agglomerans TaxID=549 RepID=A0ABD6XKC7_ENTAG|nr:hypothetical protein [Pantoea agglomerans]PVY82128.1 hypothetical protein C7427_11229 [Pantoea ananatis]
MCLFAMSLHNLEEMMAERGVMVDHFLSLALSRSLLRTPTFFSQAHGVPQTQKMDSIMYLSTYHCFLPL